MGYAQKAARTLGPCIKWYARQGEFDKAKAAAKKEKEDKKKITWIDRLIEFGESVKEGIENDKV